MILNNSIHSLMFRPVSIASLVFFRIVFGLTMLVEVGRYFVLGWIEKYFIEPTFFFKYYGFTWIEPWAGYGMYWHFAVLGILSVLITIGLFFRLASIAFVFLFSYVFLLDQALYLNHFYFVILLAAILCITPAHKAFSVDAKINPSLYATQIPNWVIVIFVAQMEIMYLYAGIVKINPDWLQLQPLTMWLGFRTDLPLIGPLFTETWAIALASYGAIALHVIGAPLLLWRKTRIWIFLCYACFHGLNHFIFSIGIFPWLTLFGTTLFFDPDWPLKLANKIKRKIKKSIDVLPDVSLGPKHTATSPLDKRWGGQQYLLVSFIIGWLAIQLLFPLRHLLYPGSPSWTEEGHRFAWQMKLRSKSGYIDFFVVQPSSTKRVKIAHAGYLSARQERKMRCKPDMILQFGQYLATQLTVEGGKRPKVYARAFCSLNGRKLQALIDENVDLASVNRDLKHATWIKPLTTALRAGSK